MPESMLLSSRQIQMGKYDKIVTVTGITDIHNPIKPKISLLVGLFFRSILGECLLHFRDLFTHGFLLILRQRGCHKNVV